MLTRFSRLASSSVRSSRSLSFPLTGTVEQVSLAEMNDLLEVLNDAFPEHEVSLLRELLLSASEESRLHIAANMLIENSKRYAQRITRLTPGRLEHWETFRSTKYRMTVEKLLIAEFQGLAKSTIRNVISENNGDYVRSREVLFNISSKSWRFNLTAWVSRRVVPPGKPSIDVTKRSTGCVRLDEEIYALGQPERGAQSSKDRQLARIVNEEEHERADALLECECCFGDFTWEDVTVCTNGHFFCRECLDRSVKEALYGQGSCLLREKGSVLCISSVAEPACGGFIASTLLSQALPVETLTRLEERFIRDQLRTSGLQLISCPTCCYAVVDNSTSARLRPGAIGACTILVVFISRLSIRYLYSLLTAWVYVSIFLLLYRAWTGTYGVSTDFTAVRSSATNAMIRVRRRRMGDRRVFRCENPRCGRASCIVCGKQWAAFHDCHREALDSRRLYVEQAMSEALKRTCPQCRTSFVKSEGCNLLACPCSYEMCYVCRADIRRTRYGHFCQHFRTEPGRPCTQCERCNLYESEDEQAIVSAAAQRAASEWTARRSNGGSSEKDHSTGGGIPVDLLSYSENMWLIWMERQLEGLIDLVFEW